MAKCFGHYFHCFHIIYIYLLAHGFGSWFCFSVANIQSFSNFSKHFQKKVSSYTTRACAQSHRLFFFFFQTLVHRCPYSAQHLMLSSLTMAEIFSMVEMRDGTRGRRSSFSMSPIELSIAFTPAGLPSTKRSLKSSVNL